VEKLFLQQQPVYLYLF